MSKTRELSGLRVGPQILDCTQFMYPRFMPVYVTVTVIFINDYSVFKLERICNRFNRDFQFQISKNLEGSTGPTGVT